MDFFRKKTAQMAVAAGVGVMVAVGAAYAHGGASGVVKKRMELMENLGDAMKALGGMLTGKAPYEGKKARAAAVALRDHAGERLTALFPEGSLKKPSEARAEIWQEWQDFEELAMRLESFAGALVKALPRIPETPQRQGMMGQGMMMGRAMAGTMQGTMQGMIAEGGQLSDMPPGGLFMMAAQTCKSCHTRYRIKK